MLTANSPSANDTASLQRALQVQLQLSSINVCRSFRDSTECAQSYLHEWFEAEMTSRLTTGTRRRSWAQRWASSSPCLLPLLLLLFSFSSGTGLVYVVSYWTFVLISVMAVCPNRWYMSEHGLKSITTVVEFFLLNKLKTLFSQSTCEIVHKYHLGETPFNPKYLTLRSTESH